MNRKQQFLLEHNKLAPDNLQVTAAVLSRFRTEKSGLFKDNNWSTEKLRRPLIMWLTSLSIEERKNMG